MFSNALKKVMLFGLIFTLVWSLNAVALADVTGDVGSTEASAEFDTIGEGTAQLKNGEAKADAISSPAGGTEGAVDAKYPPNENNTVTATNKAIDNGSNSSTSVTNYETTAKTEQEPEEGSQVVATEEVDNVVVNAPDNVELRGEKLKVIVSADKSKGTSEVIECCDQAAIRARSEHTISQVSLFDGTIVFTKGSAEAVTYYVKQPGVYIDVAKAYIQGLQVWDPTPSIGYVYFGDFSNAVAAPQDHSATLALINAILAKSNIKITKFLEVSGGSDSNSATAEAQLLQAILYDLAKNPLVTVDLAHMKSEFIEKTAKTSGDEITFEVKQETPKTTTTEEIQIQPVATVQQPVVETVAAAEIPEVSTPVETSSVSPSAFPRTGLPEQSTELLLSVLASLMLAGSVLLRKRKKITQ